MDIKEHIHKNIIGYLVPLTFTVCWIAFMAVMDNRHDSKGAAEIAVLKAEEISVERDIRIAKREKRQMKNYLDQAPSEKYDAARESNIRGLDDEVLELEDDLEKIRADKAALQAQYSEKSML